MEEDQNVQKRALEKDETEKKVTAAQEISLEDKQKMLETVTAPPELSPEDKQKILEKIRSNAGSASIKEEFINFDKFTQLYTVHSSKAAANQDGSSEPPTKRQKKSGQNKSRPKPARFLPKEKLCLNLAVDKVCPYGEQCKFNHDLAAMLKKKPSDIGPKCYNFDTFGHCQFGLLCRYGSSHISADYKNITDEERKVDPRTLTSNLLTQELKRDLRKKKVKFPRSVTFLKTLPREGKGKNKAMKENLFKDNKVSKGSDTKVASEKVSSEAVARVSTEEKLQSSQREMPLFVGQQEDISKNGEVKNMKVNVEEAGLPLTSEEKAKSISQTSRGESDINVLKDNRESVERSQPQSEVNSLSHTDKTQNDAVTIETLTPKLQPATETSMEPLLGQATTGTTTSSGPDINKNSTKKVVHPEVDIAMATDVDCSTGISPREKKQLDVKGKLILAPLTTVGNLPFRRICKKFHADITCGEMAMCTNLLMGQACEWALLRRHHTEDVFGVQLCGAFPDTMTKCAELLTTRLDLDFIDINVGCPIDLVYHKGAGSGLMNRMSKFEQIVRGMSNVMDIPLTVKMRTGVFQNKNTAHTIIPKLYDWGASVVTVHGRSREARYTRSADWEYLKMCADVASPHPFIGNGDILSFEDANEHFTKSGSAGLMIARGALVKPWIFTEIKEQRHWDISANERLDILRDFTNYGLEHWGSDSMGVDKTRRFLLEWLSFLYRYIPVGILERPPQKINQRPPFYFGRNDLETLMASSKCEDWIKISEMLLGPTPDDFQFLPKHKANSYN